MTLMDLKSIEKKEIRQLYGNTCRMSMNIYSHVISDDK